MLLRDRPSWLLPAEMAVVAVLAEWVAPLPVEPRVQVQTSLQPVLRASVERVEPHHLRRPIPVVLPETEVLAEIVVQLVVPAADTAAAAMFLASDLAANITGVNLPVDGGLSAGRKVGG